MSDYFSVNITSPRHGYHCTTEKKLLRYERSKRIIGPVRFWPNEETARRWAKRTSRSVVLRVRLDHVSYPLPDHIPAYWCPQDVVEWEVCRPRPEMNR